MIFFAPCFKVQFIPHKKPVPVETTKRMIDIEGKIPRRPKLGRIGIALSLQQLFGSERILRLSRGRAHSNQQQTGKGQYTEV